MGTIGSNAGVKHYAWKGGRHTKDGRVLVHTPGHPRANHRHPVVYEHILVAERALGRYLPAHAIVHHVNGNSLDNRPCNLVVLESRGEHMAIHRRRRIQLAGGNPWTQQLCSGCRQCKDLTAFPPGRLAARSRFNACCRECRRQYGRKYRAERAA